MTTVPELKIRWEWEAAPSVRAPEHRATWARIEISVGSDYVTLVEDRASGGSRRSIYWSSLSDRGVGGIQLVVPTGGCQARARSGPAHSWPL
jgi:hypothetical protein